MRRYRIRALAGRRFRPCTTDSRHDLPIAPNLLAQRFSAPAPNRILLADIIRALILRVAVRPAEVAIDLDVPAIAAQLKLDLSPGAAPSISLRSPVRLTRTGRAMRLIHTSGIAANAGTPDPALVRLLLQAWQWWERLADGTIDIATLAREAGISRSYVSRVVRLNFLAPKLVEAIVLGHQPAMLSAARLKMADLPTEWARQAELHLAS